MSQGAPRAPAGRGRRPTIREVTGLAGVSTAIASNVVNGRVKAETRERVAAATRVRDYTPERVARSLIARRSRPAASSAARADVPRLTAVAPETRARLADLVHENAAASLCHEPGCRRFEVLLPENGPANRVLLYEVHDDERVRCASALDPLWPVRRRDRTASTIEDRDPAGVPFGPVAGAVREAGNDRRDLEGDDARPRP